MAGRLVTGVAILLVGAATAEQSKAGSWELMSDVRSATDAGQLERIDNIVASHTLLIQLIREIRENNEHRDYYNRADHQALRDKLHQLLPVMQQRYNLDQRIVDDTKRQLLELETAKPTSTWNVKVGRIRSPQRDPYSICVLIGSLFGLILVTIMTYRMKRTGLGEYDYPSSRSILLYKMWHYPVFFVANLANLAYLGLILGLAVSGAVFAGVATLCYVGGAIIGGAAGGIIGAVIGISLALMAGQAIMESSLDRDFLNALRHDLLSHSARLHTVGGIFPLLCFVQSILLFGVFGAVVGGVVTDEAISPVAVAVVSGFFGFFASQLLSYHKKDSESGGFRFLLSGVQVVVVGLLLLPAKQLLASQPFAKSAFDHLSDFLGGDIGVNAAFVFVIGLLTEYGSSFFNGKNTTP